MFVSLTCFVVVVVCFSWNKGLQRCMYKETCMTDLIFYLSLLFLNFRWRQLMTAKKRNIGTARTAFNAVDAHVVLG